MNILITGGSSGLGANIVKKVATNRENNILFTYFNSIEKAQSLESEYKNVKAIHCDFNDEASINKLIEYIPVFNIDIIINNANGSINKSHFIKTPVQVYLESFKLNILPTLMLTQAAFKVFKQKKFGKIINIISSAIINKPPIGWSEYTANKAYLLAMSKSWATEGIKFNVTSNSISPSFMLTNLTSNTDERVLEQMIDAHPLKKILTTEEVVQAVEFLINCSLQVNGTNMIINAGQDII